MKTERTVMEQQMADLIRRMDALLSRVQALEAAQTRLPGEPLVRRPQFFHPGN